MIRSIKALSLILLLDVVYAHGMENIQLEQEHKYHSTNTVLYTEKDPRLLLELPDEIIGAIVTCTTSTTDDPFNTIALLIRMSSLCKQFERLRAPDKIKRLLNFDQKNLDDSLHIRAFFNTYFGHDYTPLFKLLVAMGARIDCYCKDLISCVSRTTNTYITEYFITHHTDDIDQQNKEGITPLLTAIKSGKPNIVKVLLQHNANIFLANEHGRNPVYQALVWKSTECIKVLIEYGLNKTIKHDAAKVEKMIIADWAKLNAHPEIYALATGKEMPPSDTVLSGSKKL
jgi:hypothetical protein